MGYTQRSTRRSAAVMLNVFLACGNFLGVEHKLIGNALQISPRVCEVKLAMNLVHIGKISCLCLLSKCLCAVTCLWFFRASIRQYILRFYPKLTLSTLADIGKALTISLRATPYIYNLLVKSLQIARRVMDWKVYEVSNRADASAYICNSALESSSG